MAFTFQVEEEVRPFQEGEEVHQFQVALEYYSFQEGEEERLILSVVEDLFETNFLEEEEEFHLRELLEALRKHLNIIFFQR